MFRKFPLLGFVVLMIATVANADGPPMFVTKWGSAGSGNGQFNYPRGISVGSDGCVYVTEWGNHRVQKFTRDGVFVTKWGSSGSGNGQFNTPVGIATDLEGNVYVAEHNNHRVQKFTSDGTFLTKWGSYGGIDGRFNKPTGVAVDASANVYVADYDGRRVQKFTSSGQWLKTWNGTEGGGPQYYRPWGLAVDAEGFIYVAEYGGNRVRRLAPDGTLVNLWGGTYGSGDGQFKAPTGVCLDRLGNVYVADHENHRIQKFTKDGLFLTKWGTQGSGNGQFRWVSGVAVDEENYIYTAGYINQRVDKFVYPMAIKVTAQVRAEHDNGSFITPSPPLVNLTVKLTLDGSVWTGVTNSAGVVGFPVARSSGGQYELLLEGPSYDVTVDNWWPWEDSDPPAKYLAAAANQDTTVFTWPHGSSLEDGAALQAAYFVERFRSDYLHGRLGYDWKLPTRAGKVDDRVQILISQFDQVPFKKWVQGAGVFNEQQSLWFFRDRCEESDVVFHEFMHAVIADRASTFIFGRGALLKEGKDEGAAMDEALADYFAASYTNDSVIVRCSWPKLPLMPCQPLRNVTQRVRYVSNYDYDRYYGSHILSGALWELRGLIDGVEAPQAPTTDALVFAALDEMLSMKASEPDPSFYFYDFYGAMKAVDAMQGSPYAEEIDLAFSSSNIGPGSVPHTPLAWNQGEGVSSVNEAGDDNIELVWFKLPGAVSYDVLMNVFDYGAAAQGSGIGAFVPIASGITDTMYTFSARDDVSEYLFSVVAVDTLGQQGYAATPVFIETRIPTSIEDGGNRNARLSGGRIMFNSPNPFNPDTRIVFELFQSDEVTLTMFDVAGRKVRDLGRKRYIAGQYSIRWDGRDNHGNQVASGPYFVLLKGNSWKASGKILLLK